MRLRPMAVLVALGVALGATLGVAGGGAPATAKGLEITVFKSPECGCCLGWIRYLRARGVQVVAEDVDDVTQVKRLFAIDDALWSCHTAILGGKYLVEGHVPLAAIDRLLAEKPDIKGIALPGMPQGSPGMSGQKEASFVIYTISEDAPRVFMEM